MQAITDADFDQKLQEATGTVLVDFWAPWCNPCKVLMPVVEEALKQSSSVQGFSLNVDENPAIPSKFHVMSLPTLILFQKGEPIQTLVGSGHTVDALVQWFDNASKA